ncbi:hypothetical protein [Noviherbaspirillum sp.]|jgi:DMSO/TMAO reductase YedYZ molybdopterin-dependent catalytic subunit|uniref:hypothetical protein n=1 Tax=Noviherbaspirillum sp. TaxID=1926288 RepID=UPI0025D661B4|nr:hypothetical protein [Noviherbaspirillum sp.]
MSALTFGSHAPANAGVTYAQNVGRAARALLAALLAVPARKQTAADEAAASARHINGEDTALFRLYRLASPYDAIMPNLQQELMVMAGRD